MTLPASSPEAIQFPFELNRTAVVLLLWPWKKYYSLVLRFSIWILLTLQKANNYFSFDIDIEQAYPLCVVGDGNK